LFYLFFISFNLHNCAGWRGSAGDASEAEVIAGKTRLNGSKICFGGRNNNVLKAGYRVGN
jgi:hypothetical protein